LIESRVNRAPSIACAPELEKWKQRSTCSRRNEGVASTTNKCDGAFNSWSSGRREVSPRDLHDFPLYHLELARYFSQTREPGITTHSCWRVCVNLTTNQTKYMCFLTNRLVIDHQAVVDQNIVWMLLLVRWI
jgi:hypothetical protein